MAGARGVRRRSSHAALLFLRRGVGDARVLLHLLRRDRRTLQARGAERRAPRSPSRTLSHLPGVFEDGRRPYLVAVSIAGHLRYGNDGSGSGGDGTWILAPGTQGVWEAIEN